MEPWRRKVGRPGGVQCVEVVKSGGCTGVWIQPGAVGAGVGACYFRNENDRGDQSTTWRPRKAHAKVVKNAQILKW